MQQMCGRYKLPLQSKSGLMHGPSASAGYETAIRGSSPFCNVFTREEFENFEYSGVWLYLAPLTRLAC
jgi:hypothetical protein